jgi:glycosyltransferase involved in cell wall biosynthesis
MSFKVVVISAANSTTLTWWSRCAEIKTREFITSDLSLAFGSARIITRVGVSSGFRRRRAGTGPGAGHACVVPVIATSHTGGGDLLTNGQEGFIGPIWDPLAIREKKEFMITHPTEREEMAAAAHRRVQNLGGWQDYGERCTSLYRKVLSQKATK